ncbi:MAG: alpha/beta fold hydrolase [Verrucomicrobiae bacterium]|nr:alpha/beta fold hydrolase [Verrucomicrobiae bacterium]
MATFRPSHDSRPRVAPPVATILVLATALSLVSCAHRVSVVDLPAPTIDPAADIAEARESWRELQRGRGDSATREKYNNSISRIVQNAELPERATATEPLVLKSGEQAIPLIEDLDGVAELDGVERIRAADHMLIKGFRERVTVDGIGSPLVLRFAPEGYAPEEGRFQPATATLDFDGPGGSPRMTIHDTLAISEARLAGSGGASTLRSDFTAPLAARFAAEDRQRINLLAMLRADRFDDKLGLSQIDATYPQKIPVVFVHGLKSTPTTWRDTMNELREDPVVRDRFEFWTFGYTTGAPIPFSAMKLREALQGMVIYRESLGAPTDNVVLVGHSMGGLLCRLMTERSGDDVWFRFFNEPLDELPLSEEKREFIRKVAYFEPQPYVKRVVFIATPHGGSQIADDPIGRIFSQLIELPTQLLTLSTAVVSESLYSLTPFGKAILGERLPTSIDQLETSSEFLKELKDAPLNPNVVFHSIIGDRGLGIGPDGSDGVVPYSSAHLEGVASEKIVPSGHRAHQNPEAIADLKRILREHAGAGPTAN